MTEPTPPPPLPVNTADSDDAGVVGSSSGGSSGSGNKAPSPTKRPAPAPSSAPALAPPSSTPLQPIMEARPRLSSVAGIEEGDEEEEGEDEEDEGEVAAGPPPLGEPVTGGSVAAAFSPVVPLPSATGGSLNRAGSVVAQPTAPTPTPIPAPTAPTVAAAASAARPYLHHTASASSVRGVSGSGQYGSQQQPFPRQYSSSVAAAVGGPNNNNSSGLFPSAADAKVGGSFQRAPSRQMSFYAEQPTLRQRGASFAAVAGATGAGGCPGEQQQLSSSLRARAPSIAATAGAVRQSFVSKLSQGDEDGDLADWKRIWVYCKSLPGRCLGMMNPMARRVYQDAVAPLHRRFSDVEERDPNWWKPPEPPRDEPGGSMMSMTLDDDLAITGQQDSGGGGSGSGGFRRMMTVEDVRSAYVLGKLPSLALQAELAATGAVGGVDAEAPLPPECGGAAAGAAGAAMAATTEVDMIRKEDFLMKMCVTLHGLGCPIPRNEYTMKLLLQTLGVEGSFSVLPSIIFVSFGAPISSDSETHILRVGGGLDCYKLRRVNHLCNQLLERRVESLPSAIAKLDAIIAEPPLYSWKALFAAYAISSGTVAPLFFKGSLIDGLLAGLLGLVAGALYALGDRSYLLGKVGTLLTAFLTSFFATIMTQHIPGTCPLAVHFGPITYLLPGWSITVSVIELSTQNLLAGTSRLMGSLMTSVLLGFGLDLGSRFVFWQSPQDWTSTAACHPVGAWTKVPLFLATVVCFSILLKAAPAQWMGMLSVAALSFYTVNAVHGEGWLDASSSTCLTAFLVGVAGNLYAQATNSPSLIPMLIGIFLLVPGGMSVKGVHALVTNDLSGGTVWSSVVVTATSILTGLLAASVIMYKPSLRVSNTTFF